MQENGKATVRIWGGRGSCRWKLIKQWGRSWFLIESMARFCQNKQPRIVPWRANHWLDGSTSSSALAPTWGRRHAYSNDKWRLRTEKFIGSRIGYTMNICDPLESQGLPHQKLWQSLLKRCVSWKWGYAVHLTLPRRSSVILYMQAKSTIDGAILERKLRRGFESPLKGWIPLQWTQGLRLNLLQTRSKKVVAGRSWHDGPWTVSTLISMSDNSMIVNAKNRHSCSNPWWKNQEKVLNAKTVLSGLAFSSISVPALPEDASWQSTWPQDGRLHLFLVWAQRLPRMRTLAKIQEHALWRGTIYRGKAELKTLDYVVSTLLPDAPISGIGDIPSSFCLGLDLQRPALWEGVMRISQRLNLKILCSLQEEGINRLH